MREIKFRAWDKVRKKMWSAKEMGEDELTLNPDGRGFVNVDGNSTKLSQYYKHIIPLQFTGLKDKNEKEIYEGDILTNKQRVIGTVKFIDGCFFKVFLEFERGKLILSSCLKTIKPEVIGNIYENQKLLK